MGESRERNARHMETIRLRDEYIKLGQALKATGMVESGVEAKEVIQESIEELGVPVTIRGEALTLQQFAQLSNIIGSKI